MNSEAQNNLIIEEIDTMKFFNENSINIEDNTELQSIVINLKWETSKDIISKKELKKLKSIVDHIKSNYNVFYTIEFYDYDYDISSFPLSERRCYKLISYLEKRKVRQEQYKFILKHYTLKSNCILSYKWQKNKFRSIVFTPRYGARK